MNDASEVLRALADAFDRHDVDGIVALYAPDATIEWPECPPASPADLRAVYESWFGVVPDVRIRIRAAIANERVGLAEVAMVGTNTGPVSLSPSDRALVGVDADQLPPTGRPLDVPMVVVIEVVDGRISSERRYLSPLSVLFQLGLLHVPA